MCGLRGMCVGLGEWIIFFIENLIYVYNKIILKKKDFSFFFCFLFGKINLFFFLKEIFWICVC